MAIKTCTLSSWQIAGFRSGVAAVVLLIAVPEARRNWSWPVALTACFYAAMLIAFVVANKLTTSANAIFLQSTAPLYIFLFSPLILREKIRRSDALVFAAIVCGMALLLHGGFGGRTAGNLVGLLSGLAWASTLTGLRWLERNAPPGSAQATAALGNLIAFFACLPLALPVTAAGPRNAAVILYLGIFQIGLAYICLNTAIRHVRAIETATLLLIEPVFNPTWAWILAGENPGGYALAGGALIVLSSLWPAWRDRGMPLKAETAS